MSNLNVTLDAGNTAAQNTAIKQYAWNRMDEDTRPASVADVTESDICLVIENYVKSQVDRFERNQAKEQASTTF